MSSLMRRSARDGVHMYASYLLWLPCPGKDKYKKLTTAMEKSMILQKEEIKSLHRLFPTNSEHNSGREQKSDGEVDDSQEGGDQIIAPFVSNQF